jgi:hypothetical protein
MGNSQRAEFRAPLEKLAESADAVVAEHARWALGRLGAAKCQARLSFRPHGFRLFSFTCNVS